jgi:mRNA interferase YafQ
MAYQIKTTGAFERDFKRCEKRGLPMEELRTVMKILAENGCLPEEYKPHKLNTGSHSDVFGKTRR